MIEMKNRNNLVKKPTVRISFILLLLIFSVHSSAQIGVKMTLEEAVMRVLKENPNLASAEANLEAARYNIAIARANYLPGLNILGSLSQSNTSTFTESGFVPASSAVIGASLSQMVFNEKYLANFKIQKYLYASQEEQLRNTRYSTISAAGIAYINLLFSMDLLEVQQQNLLVTDKNMQSATDRYEVGSTNRQEVLRWETQWYADKQTVESQKAAVIISRGSLNQLLNVPLETDENIEELTLEKNGFIFSSDIVASTANDEGKALIIRDFLVELGLANSPVLASIEQQLHAQDRQVKANKRWAIPNFNFSAGADAKFDLDKGNTEGDIEDLGYWKVGLTMYYPLIDGGANINKVKQSSLQMSALELQKNDIANSIEQSIRASMAVVISDFSNIGFSEKQMNTAQTNYELVLDAYYTGETTLLDLLDAQNQKLVADISYRVALYTFFEDLLAVEQLIGYFPFLEPEENVQAIIQELERRLLVHK